jgi:hypothetical protein
LSEVVVDVAGDIAVGVGGRGQIPIRVVCVARRCRGGR